MLITEIKHNNLHRFDPETAKCEFCGILLADAEPGENCKKRSAKSERLEN